MRERHRAEARGGKGTKSGWPGETRAERHRTASHPSRRRGRRRPPAPAPAPASCNLQAVTVQVNRSGPAVRIAARVGLRFSEVPASQSHCHSCSIHYISIASLRMPRLLVRASNGDMLNLDSSWLSMLYSTLPLNVMIKSRESMDELIRYGKERDKITRRWATIKTVGRKVNNKTVEARSVGALPTGVTTDSLTAAVDRDFVRHRDPVLLEMIGWGACRLQMRGLVSACYNQMLSDGIPEQEARRRLDYYG
uniref:Uncharacterized protein n=1 Tax=Oryza punctata TaxID=4537 RepID=A0A0E0KUG3_ORYPU